MLWALVPILGILAVFGVPAYMFKRYFDLKERQLPQKGEADLNLARELESLRERVQILESIVVEGDYELHRKLSALDKDKDKSRGLPEKATDPTRSR